MKHIIKNIANEPESLRNSRNDSQNTTYESANFDATALKQALLDEQGYLCAYCMGKISLEFNENHKPKVEVEHLKPREKYPELSLDYNNLIAVCNGLSNAYPEKRQYHHCDKTQGNEGKMNGMVELKTLNPLHKSSSETLLIYTLNGEIKSINDNPDVENDLNVILNLNNETLIKKRRIVIDVVKESLIKEKPAQQWTKALFEKHLKIWSIRYNGKFRQYCMIAIWFLNNLKTKPKYQ